MKTPAKIIIILLVVGAAAAAIVLKGNKSRNSANSPTPGGTTGAAVSDAEAKLPKLLDLGANKCIPCKAMAPILEGLKKEYVGRMNVEFIDVWQDEDAGKKYGVEMIPTQIFFDATGKELFRHTGFFGKEDILAKWKELGVDLGGKASVGIVRETPVAASYLYGMDAKGRATVKPFESKEAATKEPQAYSGNLVSWDMLKSKELATRCAFCDRAVYPEDACAVKFGSTHGYGCCTHCSLGVAARLKQNIEVDAKDALTGESIRVKTLDGQIASSEPATAIAWFGQKKGPDGKWTSAGCFKQGFFVNEANLQKWLDARPAMTGRQITIGQALSDKMKLSPEQISKACKLGECN